MGSYRISKILGELNIGLDTASDFLKEKGHDALKNRNAKIDQDQYDALVDQFASDKSKKVKSEELIEQKRIEREAITAAREAEDAAKAAEVAKTEALVATPDITEKIDQSPKPVAKAEVKAEPEAVAKAPAKPDEVIKAKVSGLKVKGKIDLDALKKPASKAKGKAAAKPATESAPAPAKPEAPKAVKPKAESKPEIIGHTTVYQNSQDPRSLVRKLT